MVLSIDRKSKAGMEETTHQEPLASDFPTDALWERNGKADFSHTLPTAGVSTGPNGTQQTQCFMRPVASRVDPHTTVQELPGQDSNLEKQDQNLL